MKKAYIAIGLDQQGRQVPTMACKRLAAEDSTGVCDTCPGELAPAEELQLDRYSSGLVKPGEVFAVVALVALASCSALHLALQVLP